MVADETVVTVIDLGRERATAPAPKVLPGSPGILEGALLVTVGLTTAAVEAVTRAVMTALGETLPPAERRRSKRVERPGRRVRDRGDDRRRRARVALEVTRAATRGRGKDRDPTDVLVAASRSSIERRSGWSDPSA